MATMSGKRLGWMTADTVLGRMLVAENEHGLCQVQFGTSDAALLRQLRSSFPVADIAPLPVRRAARLRRLLHAAAAGVLPEELPDDVRLDARGTPFQLRVWRELRRIPRGSTRSYADIARRIGAPSATRAVARACAANPLALFIPCHRVVRSDGALAGYRWGLARKRRLLAAENSAVAA